MRDASQWRLALARVLAKKYAAYPKVHAAFVGGSAARQQADRFSDLELAIIRSVAPTEQQRAAVITGLNGDMRRLYSYNQQEQI